jgi:tRNA(Ile2) C34 agmatinyltransferase TiaS
MLLNRLPDTTEYKKCPHCGILFEDLGGSGRTKYCSKKCGDKFCYEKIKNAKRKANNPQGH